MPQLTEEQIVLANSIDLLTYLQTHAPQMVRRSGADEYCLVEHDSFKMSNGKWYWHSRGFGGHTALCYLRKVEG
ncbi:MAG: topoisomerase, partial [Oscillospiraceae bacterium]|nr:topoisomerase [Oscillospiraceae bacterium]